MSKSQELAEGRRHRIAMAPYNKRMQRTRQTVTHFANRKMLASLPRRCAALYGLDSVW
jgi:hypothetical protein